MRLVLDTNIVVSALRSMTGASNALLRQVGGGRFGLLVSHSLFLEYESVLKRPEHRLVHGLSLAEVDGFLGTFAAAAESVDIAYRWRPQLADANDEMVLEAAINGRADRLVTFNIRHFKPAAARFGITLSLPGTLMKELKGE